METLPNDSETFRIDLETFPNDSETFRIDLETFPNDLETLPNDSETFRNDLETFPNDLEARFSPIWYLATETQRHGENLKKNGVFLTLRNFSES